MSSELWGMRHIEPITRTPRGLPRTTYGSNARYPTATAPAPRQSPDIAARHRSEHVSRTVPPGAAPPSEQPHLDCRPHVPVPCTASGRGRHGRDPTAYPERSIVRTEHTQPRRVPPEPPSARAGADDGDHIPDQSCQPACQPRQLNGTSVGNVDTGRVVKACPRVFGVAWGCVVMLRPLARGRVCPHAVTPVALGRHG
jgi:hypothetical protein